MIDVDTSTEEPEFETGERLHGSSGGVWVYGPGNIPIDDGYLFFYCWWPTNGTSHMLRRRSPLRMRMKMCTPPVAVIQGL